MVQNDQEITQSEGNPTASVDTLVREHRMLDEKVSELSGQNFLSSEQNLELTRLKKEKLRIKDQIAHLSLARASA